jgi:hypothetical protein
MFIALASLLLLILAGLVASWEALSRRHVWTVGFVCAVLFVALLVAGAAGAQVRTVPCAPRDEVAQRLAIELGQVSVFQGVSRGTLVETFVSPETHTWSITVTGANGTTCLAASGEAFEAARGTPLAGDAL